MGSSGDDVKVLQSALATDKSIYPSGIVSGYYGELTKQAVINFQQKYNLSQTGEIDQQTADKFNEVYGFQTAQYYLNLIPISSPYILPTVNSQQNTTTDSNSMVDCIIGTKCGSFKTTRSECMQYSYCCEIGSQHIPVKTLDECVRAQNANNSGSVNNQTTNNSSSYQNNVPVFLSYYSYTLYCPAQNVSAVQSINSTMETKKSTWVQDYNICLNNFYNTDSCYLACKQGPIETYGDCISKCPSPVDACKWVYSERDSLYNQIKTLCK